MPITYQTTLEREASLRGSTLHTGEQVLLTLKPAEAGTGYVFERNDLPDRPRLAAHVEHVMLVERATTLSEGAVRIHTVEHILSALRGMGIDNAVIEMNSNEPPIGDGSADAYAQLIKRAGKRQLSVARRHFELREPLYVHGANGAYIAALPADSLRISCTNANHSGLFTQYHDLEVTPDTYEAELSRARTFVFYEEIEELSAKGLIRGGSLENAIIIRGGSILTKEPMRYNDEFVRHKILDIVGDLALFPLPLKAHILAARPSHGLNVELARRISREYRNYVSQLMPTEHIPVGEGALDINDLIRIMPQRYPFLMIDRVLKFEGDDKVTACKNVSINEPYFQGHFPNHPVMPGVMQIEAMAQAGSLLLLRRAENAGRAGFFMSADKIKFRRQVLPGDTLIIQVEMVKQRGRIGRTACQCVVNGEVVSEGELTFVIQ